MKYEEFYSELGKLLYAIADIDKRISPQEKETLLKIVSSELVPTVNHIDEFGTSVGYYPEFEFEYLDDDIAEVEPAFDSFINFIEEHHTTINKQMKDTAFRVTKELAGIYYGTNKKEKDLILKLKKTLKKLK